MALFKPLEIVHVVCVFKGLQCRMSCLLFSCMSRIFKRQVLRQTLMIRSMDRTFPLSQPAAFLERIAGANKDQPKTKLQKINPAIATWSKKHPAIKHLISIFVSGDSHGTPFCPWQHPSFFSHELRAMVYLKLIPLALICRFGSLKQPPVGWR